MSDKKHIDRVFQEKLKGFEANPSDDVWKNISAQLQNEKKDRKVIPLWWKFAGIAAGILLLLTLGSLIFNDSDTLETPIMVDTVEDGIKTDDEGSNKVTEKEIKEAIKPIPLEKKENIVDVNQEQNPLEVDSNQSEGFEKINTADRLEKTKKSKTFRNQTNPTTILGSQKADISIVSNDNLKQKEVQNTKLTKGALEVTVHKKEEPKLIEELNSNKIIDSKQVNTDLISETISEKIAENKTQEKLDDSPKMEKSSITDEILAINEDINEEEKETTNRWQINPNFAPVYFSSLGDGSSIDNQFIDNSKSGNINISYGISAGYAINNRLTIKSGVNKLKLSYDTNDVVTIDGMAANSNSRFYRNLNFDNASNMMFLSANNVSLAQVPDEFTTAIKASLSQELEFIELPVELKYSVIKKKFGLNVIGGISMLLLSDNNVFAVVDDSKTHIGEASNLNNTSYSANLGLGLDYNISKNINLNIDPMFKYQINTFNNTSGDFNPYFIGVYSGVNIKF